MECTGTARPSADRECSADNCERCRSRSPGSAAGCRKEEADAFDERLVALLEAVAPKLLGEAVGERSRAEPVLQLAISRVIHGHGVAARVHAGIGATKIARLGRALEQSADHKAAR